MIDLGGITFRYPGCAPVLCDVSVSIEENERVVLLGANGCGKTTLLRVLDALIFPQTGMYHYDGEEITARKLKEGGWGRRFRSELVLLFQQPEAMLFNPTVYDEIAYGLRQLNVDRLDERVRYWASALGLERHLEEPPFRLSGGEKQKLCLAALLAIEPRVLLLDEPTANLDPRSTGWLIDFLQQLEVTIVSTTHNLGLAGELGERVLVLSERHELIFDGTLANLMADEETLRAANLVHTHGGRHFHAHEWS